MSESVLHFKWWEGRDSNPRKHKLAGLQPAPFDRSGTRPRCFKNGARRGSRTPNQLVRSQLLYPIELSGQDVKKGVQPYFCALNIAGRFSQIFFSPASVFSLFLFFPRKKCNSN